MKAVLEIQLAQFGFVELADALRDAKGWAAEFSAVTKAIAAIDGYLLACRRHARALQHTAADFEREQLAFIEGALRGRLEQLTRRSAWRDESLA